MPRTLLYQDHELAPPLPLPLQPGKRCPETDGSTPVVGHSDITHLPTRQGAMYLSLVTDAFSRRIVGHHVHTSLHTVGCLAALERAVRGAGRAATGGIHHSGRGS